MVPSPWARLHLSRPFQSGPPSFAIYVLLLLSTMGREERQKAMASSEIGRVLSASWLLLCFYGVAKWRWWRTGGSPSSVVASGRCGGGRFRSTPEPAVRGLRTRPVVASARLLLNVLGPPNYACEFGYPRPICWCMGFSQQKQSFGPFNYLLFIGPSTLHALHGPVSFLVHSDRFFSSLTQMHAVLVLSCSSKPVAPRTFVKQKQGAWQERRISKWSQK